jgi:hypothetical protein
LAVLGCGIRRARCERLAPSLSIPIGTALFSVKRHRDISMLLMHVMGWSTIVPFSRMAEVVFMVFMHN